MIRKERQFLHRRRGIFGEFRQYELQHYHRGDDPVQEFCYGMILLLLYGITPPACRAIYYELCLPACQPND